MTNLPLPDTYERLITQVTEQFPKMKKSFQRITRFMVQNPNAMAVESVKVIADQAGVQPSSLVRFAKHMGYNGFSEMKRVFQSHLISTASSKERLESFSNEVSAESSNSTASFLQSLVSNDIAALNDLKHSISSEVLEKAVSLLEEADTIYVLGQLRSLSVAYYIRYLLLYLRQNVRLLDSSGGLATEEAELMNERLTLLQTAEPYIGKYYSQDYVRRNILRQTDMEILEQDKLIEKEIKDGTIPDTATIDPTTGLPFDSAAGMD
ncbi:MAG: portal protein, partial [bacterium]